MYFTIRLELIFCTALILRTTQAIVLPRSTPVPGLSQFLPLPNVTIYDYGLGIWPENLNVRANGQILSTLINRPEVWQINPFKQQEATLIHTFEGKGSTLGIVETFPDIFHVIVGNFTTTPEFNGVNGTFGVWELDFTAENVAEGSLATVSHVVDIPQAEALDGMEVLNHESGLVLVADTKAGVVYTVDVVNKSAEATINSPLFYSSPELYVGLDGIKLRSNATHSYLYFTNAVQGAFGRVQIDLQTGYSLSAVEDLPVFANGAAQGFILDDFIFDNYGNAYLTNAGENQGIYLVAAPVFEATEPVFITPITGPTAVRFGRTEADKNSLYITSTGGDLAYPNQTFTITSKLVRIDVDPQSSLA